MKLSIKALTEILQYAEKYDLDEELAFDYEDRFQSITIYLNEHAWNAFKRLIASDDDEK